MGVGLKRQKTNRIDALVDELLVEILCRLPCHKTATLCKLVCKRWGSLVSDPFFMSRFVTIKACQSVTPCAYEDGVSMYDDRRMAMMKDRTMGFVVRKGHRNTRKGFMIHLNDPIYSPKNLSCSRLPRFVNKGLPPNLTVVATCNDLTLYQRHGDKQYFKKFEFYICNSQTKQWLALPPLTHDYRSRNIGLICDPYYTFDGNRLTTNDAYQACVVFLIYKSGSHSKFSAYLLSPTTGGLWRTVVLSLPIRCKLVYPCHFHPIGRKLYFNTRRYLFGFDPFVDVSNGTSKEKDIIIRCDSIPMPRGLMCGAALYGVFHDKLYTCDRLDEGRYRVWVLEDYVTGKWSLRHSIAGQDWIPRDHRLAELVNTRPVFGSVIGFHPANPDAIYVLSERWIVLCNLPTKEMDIAFALPKSCWDLFPCFDSFDIRLPVWPTPLPILVQGDYHQ
ncbi:hypothetical protein RND81_09G194200 [Saponaria officinalis]|uniref:F-box domain-containing protein n=1 Tax=Saponaria officinalis TaxID=3572 RepID=A0AAW1INV7_SAPOF